jgi:hypothetical protein
VKTVLLFLLSLTAASAADPPKKLTPQRNAVAAPPAHCEDAAASCGALQPFGFLLGKWNAAGGGQPGTALGAFSFDAELDHHILVRHNYAQYDSSRHDDLLIVYLEDTPRAIYFDSEGHVIRYRVTLPGAGSVVFESDGSQKGPRYRLSYVLKGKVLEGTFEVADSATAPYKNYLSWTATK